MTLAEARSALRSDSRTVLIHAPAGTGKTFEAVGFAVDAASGLPPRREVLLLAHTNAAVDEFRKRSRAVKAAVRATTFDSFATEIISAYAVPLGLPHPLRPQREGSKIPGTTPFAVLIPTLVGLLERAPAVAAALAGHYPIVVCDEHQDASQDQQRLVEALVQHGVCVRYFGDPMQAIYDFKGQELVNWDDLTNGVDRVGHLNEPQRWKDVPELGKWLLDAHVTLSEKRALPPRPACVVIERVSTLKDGALANPVQARPFMEIKDALHRATDGKIGSLAVLTYTGAHRRGLQALLWDFDMFEGSDLQDAHEAVYAAEQAQGGPRALVEVALRFLSICCTGFNRELRSQILRACGTDGVTTGRIAKDAAPIVDRFRVLYDDPSLAAWSRAVGGFMSAPPGIRPVMRTSLRAIARLGRGAATYEHFAQQTGDTRSRTDLPNRAVYTIHTAKGREFDHVVLAHCGASQFPDEPSARRLLYVAISRARRSLHILTPGDYPSPLLGPRTQ